MSESLPIYLVLLSALFHALWNVVAKKSQHKGAFVWSITFWGCLFLVFPVALWEWRQWPNHWQAWLFPLLSIFAHTAYTFCLVEAYRRVPFAVAYPVSRGLAQIFIVLSGLFLFQESPGSLALLGVALILFGIQATAMGSLRERWRALSASPWPLLVALCICFYTTIDHQSVKSVPPLTVCLIANCGQCLLLARLQLREFAGMTPQQRRDMFKHSALWGLISTSGYCLFLYAQHIGGMISILGPLRETSIMIGMLLSFYTLKEEFHWSKILAACFIVMGILALKFQSL